MLIAQKMGIPDFIVEIRHMATHQALPSMDLLVPALLDLYNWLIEEY